METVRIVGRRTRVVNPAYVYLPPQYFQPQYARQRFPVIVALSGYPGGTFLLAQHLRVPQTAAALIRAGRMQPTVIVMLRPTIAPPRDTQCVDVPDGPQAETFFTREVPDALRSHYRVGRDPGGWGVLGYSSGGSCALQLVMRHPRTYTSAAALSPDFRVANDPTTGNLFGDGKDRVRRRQEHDLRWRLRASARAAGERAGGHQPHGGGQPRGGAGVPGRGAATDAGGCPRARPRQSQLRHLAA